MISENARKVLEKRYLLKNNDGKVIETPEQLFKRVAKAISKADGLYGASETEIKHTENEFYDMMNNLDFLPNSPTLMNADKPDGQLSACFVLPVEDSMEGIFDTIKHTALIHKSGGGTGFSFSRLRQSGARVNSTNGVASGAISFMKVFNSATEAVKQGGTRRGANMGMLRIDHPDILEFIDCKNDQNELNNFNLSIAITDMFMDAVRTLDNYELIEPHTGRTVAKLNARMVFDKIVLSAWKNGEPGIIFIDAVNKRNPTPMIGEIESTNPCGELPLLPYEACNLGSINLGNMVINGEFDFEKLANTVKKAVHFLDNVIDVNKYPLPQIENMTRGTRKIGLGVMGLADTLCMLGIAYNSDRALGFANMVMGTVHLQSKLSSIELAEKRGSFPYHNKSVYKTSMRNATTNTIAPTGTISIIAGCSSGIEPLFGIAFERNVMDNDTLLEVNPTFENIAKKEGFYSDELMKKIARHGTVKGLDEVPRHIQEIFVTAHDIAPEHHIKMQAVFQRNNDNAVSKTINMTHDATLADVRNAYMQAFESGCKGITIYRDGSRDGQVINVTNVNLKQANVCPECGDAVEHEGGCMVCKNCGLSACAVS